MQRNIMILSLLLVMIALCAGICSGENTGALKNSRYELSLLNDNSVEVSVEGIPSQILSPAFTVMYSQRDPGFGINRVGPFDRSFPAPFSNIPKLAQRWSFYSDHEHEPEKELKPVEGKGDIKIRVDSKGERTFVFTNPEGKIIEKLERHCGKGTVNPYLAGQKTTLNATRASLGGYSILWHFEDQPAFSFKAELVLPAGEADPQITYHLKVKKEGFYSVAFTGSPWIDADQAIPVPQKAAEKEFQQLNYVLSEANMALPRVHIATGQMNSALVIDPQESPFRLVEDRKGVWTYSLGAESNSRFGMMLEKKNGRLRPVSFAPLMGGYESKMRAGDRYDFTLRYVLRPGEWEDTYKYIARKIYNFRDMRDNSGSGSINRTLENIIDYLSDREGRNYCMWHEEQKYYNYWSDQAGIFKPFSPMFVLAAAILMDDEEFYKKRALPMVEYALSRKYNMFMPYDVFKTGMADSAQRGVGFPYPETVQLAELAGMFQDRTYAFRYYAEKKGFEENNFMHSLAKYRMTGDKKFLDEAAALADNSGKAGFMDMLEMYEQTEDRKYLKAAVKSAYRTIYNYNLFPMVPDTMVTVDTDNKAPIHGHAYQRHEDWGFAPPRNLYAPEQTVPAWRVSLTGTQCEVYRGGYWPWVHGQLMRLATHAEDDFLRDMQRWAMVGRYANYPGDFRSNAHSLAAELPDAPMHYIFETNFSTFNPGHACEWVGAVMDFLISDCFNRSEKKIDFPSRCMYGSPFRVKTYGDRPGRFYDEGNVRLWMPRRLLNSSSKQVDYIAGYGNGKFYIAFWNQSFKNEDATVRLDRDLVDFSGTHKARFWQNNIDKGTVEVSENKINFNIEPKGIAAYAIDDVTIKTRLHAKMFDKTAIDLGPESITQIDAPFGKVHAMLITMGKGLTTSFVYTDALPENVIHARLKYRQGSKPWREMTDSIFPYEFTTEIDEAKGDFQCVLEVKSAERKILKSELITLDL